MRFKRYFGVLIMLILLIFSINVTLAADTNEIHTQSKVEFVNGAGNITNLGLTYYYNGFIYYCNASDGYRLYRTNIYENSTQKISDEGTFNINIEDNWIYYSNDSNLCQMKTDGSNKRKLCNDNPRDIIVADGWIYYGLMEDNGQLYRIKTDGTDRQLITDDYKENKNSGNFGVAGDFVYYVSTDGNKIYRIKTDGTDRTKLNDNYSVAIIVSDNWIYYGNASDFKIYRIKNDGSNNEKVCNDKFNFFNVINDYIYYSNASKNGKLYRINISGNNRILINNDIPMFINISGGWIYYLSNGNFCRAQIDSDEHEIIGSSLNTNKNTNSNTNTNTNSNTNSSNTEVKQVICPSCNGAGRITCSSCKGTGSTGTKTKSAPNYVGGETEYYEVPIMCWGCGGSGTTICPTCQGTGVILTN